MHPLKTLLIVDDSAADVESLIAAFARVSNALTVVVAHDGDEGLEAIRAHRPDLVLLDLNMPRMPGVEVVERARADRKLGHVPILMLSTSKAAEDRKASLKAGARAYIVKPTTFEGTVDLAAAIEAFWRRAR